MELTRALFLSATTCFCLYRRNIYTTTNITIVASATSATSMSLAAALAS